LVFAAGAELPVVGHFKFSLSGLVSSAARTEFATGQLRTQLLGAEALGCGVFGLSFLGIQGCAGLAGGTVRASGLGYDENSDVFLAWAAGVLRISLDLPRTAPVGARLFVDGFVNLVRPEPSVVGGTSAALVTARLGVALGLELAVMWP
jgi:hypothetical protein